MRTQWCLFANLTSRSSVSCSRRPDGLVDPDSCLSARCDCCRPDWTSLSWDDCQRPSNTTSCGARNNEGGRINGIIIAFGNQFQIPVVSPQFRFSCRRWAKTLCLAKIRKIDLLPGWSSWPHSGSHPAWLLPMRKTQWPYCLCRPKLFSSCACRRLPVPVQRIHCDSEWTVQSCGDESCLKPAVVSGHHQVPQSGIGPIQVPIDPVNCQTWRMWARFNSIWCHSLPSS